MSRGASDTGPVELLRLQVETLHLLDDAGRLVAKNDGLRSEAPLFFLGRTEVGNIWRFHARLPHATVSGLERICAEVPPASPVASRLPAHHDDYLRIVAPDATSVGYQAGPAYVLDGRAVGQRKSRGCVPIAVASSTLLRQEMGEWLEDIEECQPFIASVADGHAVAVCASVRITDGGHEAGVDTAPAYRRQGHATRAAAAWATAVEALGAVPFYSTSWDNEASMRVARRLGAQMFRSDYHVTTGPPSYPHSVRPAGQ